MLKVLFAMVSLFSVGANASQIGCATTISISVAQMLQNTNEVVDGDAKLEKDFSSVAVYSVQSGAPKGQIGIPSRTNWIVVVRKGPQATCDVEEVFLDASAK